MRLWVDGQQQLRLHPGPMPTAAAGSDASPGPHPEPGPRPPTNWYSLDFRSDPRGLWCGEGPILDTLRYRDMGEPPQPWPWLPRDWRAQHLPQLQAR